MLVRAWLGQRIWIGILLSILASGFLARVNVDGTTLAYWTTGVVFGLSVVVPLAARQGHTLTRQIVCLGASALAYHLAHRFAASFLVGYEGIEIHLAMILSGLFGAVVLGAVLRFGQAGWLRTCLIVGVVGGIGGLGADLAVMIPTQRPDFNWRYLVAIAIWQTLVGFALDQTTPKTPIRATSSPTGTGLDPIPG